MDQADAPVVRRAGAVRHLENLVAAREHGAIGMATLAFSVEARANARLAAIDRVGMLLIHLECWFAGLRFCLVNTRIPTRNTAFQVILAS